MTGSRLAARRHPQWQYPVYTRRSTTPFVVHTLSRPLRVPGSHGRRTSPLYCRDTYNETSPGRPGSPRQHLPWPTSFSACRAYAPAAGRHLRRNMTFAYSRRLARRLDLTLNSVCARVFTPYWRRNTPQIRPARTRGSRPRTAPLRRSLIDPDRNNFGPRLGFAYTVTPRTVIRGGYGISYVHFSRAGGGDLLPINGPQVVNAVVNQTVPTAATFVPAEKGYPDGLADPSRFNPLTANITYMPRASTRARSRAGIILGAARADAQHALDVAYVGNRGDDLLLFANYIRPRRTTPR